MDLNLITALDGFFLLVTLFSVVWIFSIVSGYGGNVGKSLKLIGWGVVLMGFSHLVEVSTLYLPNHHEATLIIFSHHLISATSFVLIAFGFRSLIKK